jgi:hypothetical protein
VLHSVVARAGARFILEEKSLDNHTITQHHNTSDEDESDSDVITDRNQKKRNKKQIVPPPSNLGEKAKKQKIKGW